MNDTTSGKMIVVTAPSGAGKTTIVRHLLSKFSNLCFSVSATTRGKRQGELEGKDYYFMSVEAFKQSIDQDLFVEWQEVYSNSFYGTLKKEVDRIWSENKVIIFDVDVKGAMKIKTMFGDRCLSIFIEPPSLEILIERLKARKTENDSATAARIERMRMELTYADKFDAVILNDHLTLALLESERLVKSYVRSN